MARVSQSTKGLYNGVSQQAASMRLTNQVDEMVNSYATLAEGCRKRPPMIFLRKILGIDDKHKAHFILRSPAERYVVIYGQGDIEAWNIDTGVKCTIEFKTPLQSKDYLNGEIELITIADYTFVLNRTKEVAMDISAAMDSWDGYGYVYVTRGVASTTYSVTQGGATSTYTTGENISANMDTWKTTKIASELASGLSGATVNGSMIRLPLSGQVFAVSDSWGNQALVGWKDTIQKFEDLPAHPPWKIKVKVTEDSDKGFKKYYVENDPAQSGVWEETRGWGIRNAIDPETMPHVLVNDSLNHFTFDIQAWDERIVGDEDTSPNPSFVGSTIRDIVVYRGRLGFISGTGVILSKADDFFTFWPETITEALDSDPIDQTVTHMDILSLERAVAFNEALLIFSDKAQFQLSAEGSLTNKTSKLDQTTAFACDTRCRPVGIGQSVYFATPKGSFTGVMEYYVDYQSVSNDAADITAHIPRYIPHNITRMVGSSNENIIAMWSEESPNVLYIYKYYWDGDNKVQSSWGRWELSTDKILGMYLDKTKLYLVTWTSARGTALQTIDLQLLPDTGMAYDVHLDERQVLTSSWDSTSNVTTWTADEDLDPSCSLVLGADAIGGNAGSLLHTASIVGNKVTVAGKHPSSAYVGIPYTQTVKLSEQYFRVGGSNETFLSSRLQLANMNIDISNTGGFKAKVVISGSNTWEYEYGPQLGTSGFRIGVPFIKSSDIFKFPIRGRSDSVELYLINDTHYPSAFQNAEWTGEATQRSQRV